MSNKTLAERLNHYNKLQVQIIEANGELTAEVETDLVSAEQSIAAKAENYHFAIEHFGLNAKHFRDKSAELARIAKGLERAQDFLKNNLKHAMMTMGVEELTAGGVKVKLIRCSQSLVIEDEAALPRSFTQVLVAVRRDALKEALEGGQDVPGARLEGGIALRFYANREVK